MKTARSPAQVRASVKRLLKEFGGQDLKVEWGAGGAVLRMSLYGYRGILAIGQGEVQAALVPAGKTSMPGALIRRELVGALKKICVPARSLPPSGGGRGRGG